MSTVDVTCTTGWFKSSRSSETQSCVEVRVDGDAVLIRDSKYLRNPANDPTTQPVIEVPVNRWTQILELSLGKDSGEIFLSEGFEPEDVLSIVAQADGGVTVRSSGQNVELTFTPDEWDAFAKGIADGEFAFG